MHIKLSCLEYDFGLEQVNKCKTNMCLQENVPFVFLPSHITIETNEQTKETESLFQLLTMSRNCFSATSVSSLNQ